MRWYVVHAYSGYEKQVMRALIERIGRSGLEGQFGEVLVPTEEVVEIRSGQKRRSERKFFPANVLVRWGLNENTWPLVKTTPRRWEGNPPKLRSTHLTRNAVSAWKKKKQKIKTTTYTSKPQ